jgi:S-adenosylmethionine hydrolase
MKQDHKIITLMTDFGLKDIYVAVMKGVIYQINPQINIIDLTHEIPPQNIAAGRFNLLNAYPYFPEKTVHIAVVDPEVGTQRRAIAIQFNNSYLVGPDNGLLTGILEDFLTCEMEVINRNNVIVVELNHPEYWRTAQPSTTFHGRDIFASVGAHLVSGVPLEKLGTIIDPTSLIRLSLPPYQVNGSKIQGCIQYIDHFGNLVTNIPGEAVGDKHWYVEIPQDKNKKSQKQKSKKLSKKQQKKFKQIFNSPLQMLSGSSYLIGAGQTYGDVPRGDFVALVGSHGWVEIALNGGNAQQKLKVDWGTKIQAILGKTRGLRN